MAIFPSNAAAPPQKWDGSIAKEVFCPAPHCQGMVCGNGCAGYYDDDGDPRKCPVSGQVPQAKK